MIAAGTYPPLASAYRVSAKRWRHGWELSIIDAEHGEIGVTCTDDGQPGTGWASPDYMVRDWLMTVHDLTPREVAAIPIEIDKPWTGRKHKRKR